GVPALDAPLALQRSRPAQGREGLLEELEGYVPAPRELCDRHRLASRQTADTGELRKRLDGVPRLRCDRDQETDPTWSAVLRRMPLTLSVLGGRWGPRAPRPRRRATRA